MMRTAANVNRDGDITMTVAHGEDNISMDVFNDPDARTIEPVHCGMERCEKISKSRPHRYIKKCQLAKTTTIINYH